MIEDSVLTTLMRNCRIATNFFDRRFKDKKCPLNASQYDLLRIIGNMTKDGKDGDLNNLTLSLEFKCDYTTISRRVKNLVELRYVSASISAYDGRNHVLKITTQGSKLLKDWEALYRQCDREFQEGDSMPENAY